MRSLTLSLFVALLIVAPALPVIADPGSGRTLQETTPLSEWTRTIGDDLADEEYRISWQEPTQLADLTAAWQAPNRAQGFRTFFTPDGIRLISRTVTSDWSLDLSLVTYGRGKISRNVERAVLSPDGERIRLNRREIDEWFVNRPDGLKHNFTLYAPPEDDRSTGRGAPIHLNLRVAGSLTPIAGTDGRSVRFVGPSGMGVIYYRDLLVRDASGSSLTAWMEIQRSATGSVVQLFIDDREAVYPIEIDPLATSADWTDDVDQAGAWLGISVGTAGDVNNDGYDDVIVGAFHYDDGLTNEGAAFLYLGSADGLSSHYDWMVAGGEAVAFAGRSVGTAGDVNDDGYDDIMVGVPLLDPAGSVWVFHGSVDGPSTTPDWEGESQSMFGNDSFGHDVSTAGDVNGDGYDDVIIGARLYDSPGFNQDGRAFVFLGSATGLPLEPVWFGAGLQDNAAYGIGVGGGGDVNGDGYDDVIVGAYQYTNGQEDEGRVYVYHGSASGPSIESDWTYENNHEGACLGASVGMAGDVNGDGYDDVIVGAAYHQCFNFPTSPVGKAYAFRGSPTGLPAEPSSTREMTQVGSMFGGQLARAGDVNADGYDDIVVGAGYYDNGETDEGAAFLYLGSPTGLSTTHAWMAEANQPESRFGIGAGTAGDVNGDGADDVIIGAYLYETRNPLADQGRAFVYLGSVSSPTAAGAVGSLVLDKADNENIALEWSASCMATDVDYAVYEGVLGDFASHEPLKAPNPQCTTAGATNAVVLPAAGDRYYLVVPQSSSREGSYGTDGGEMERPQGPSSCLVQELGSCS